MERKSHQQRRRRRRVVLGKLIWLVDQATGELADAITRDLFTDGRDFDELGWRGLWAYITAAPPGTAIHYQRSKGWSLAEKIAAESLYEHQKLGAKLGYNEIPDRPTYPGSKLPPKQQEAKSWETVTLDEMVPPEVRELLRGA